MPTSGVWHGSKTVSILGTLTADIMLNDEKYGCLLMDITGVYPIHVDC